MSDTVAPGEILRFMKESKADTKELGEKVSTLHTQMSVVAQNVERVLEQTTKTNGRVNKLEDENGKSNERIKSVENKILYFMAASATVVVVSGIAWAVFTFFYNPKASAKTAEVELTDEQFNTMVKIINSYDKDNNKK